MLQPAAVTRKSPEPISHAFLRSFPPFPTSSCSYTMYIYLHRIHSSILVPTKIHYLRIFYELGNFLKVKRWMGVLGKDYIKERDIFCYPLGPCLLFPIPCYFVFPHPFLGHEQEAALWSLSGQFHSCHCPDTAWARTNFTQMLAAGWRNKGETLRKRGYSSNNRKESLSILQIPSHHENHLSSYWGL